MPTQGQSSIQTSSNRLIPIVLIGYLNAENPKHVRLSTNYIHKESWYNIQVFGAKNEDHRNMQCNGSELFDC